MADDDDGRPPTSSRRSSVFSLAEFTELVSAALDINSDRLPDAALRLAFNPEFCPFLSTDKKNSKAHCAQPFVYPRAIDATSARRRQYQYQFREDMYITPPVDSIDLGSVNCVPCTPVSIPSAARSPPVPVITITTPPSPSRSSQVLRKIRKGAKAIVTRTRTLSSPAKYVPSSRPQTREHSPLPNPVLLNPNNPNYEPIPKVSMSTSYKNNVHLRSAVSLVDLECLNNDSAYSLATNTANFYDDESDFVPYLPLACQYERAFPKTPSMPALPLAATAVTIADSPKSASKTGIGTNPANELRLSFKGNSIGRSRCISTGQIRNPGPQLGRRKRPLSAATDSSATTDTASPVTPHSAAFMTSVRAFKGDHGEVRSSSFSLDSTSDSDVLGDENSRGLSFDDDDDPFAKGSVQIIRTKSRAKPAFQLYNPEFIIGPGSAECGDSVVATSSENEKRSCKSPSKPINVAHRPSPYRTTLGSPLPAPPLAQSKSHSSLGRSHGKRSPRPSVSPMPISRMKRQPFPSMPGEKDDCRQQGQVERTLNMDEWTLCLGTRDVPGSGQVDDEGRGDGTESGIDTQENTQVEEDEKVIKQRTVKISEKTSIVDWERGGNCNSRKKSIPQLRITQFIESGTEDANKGDIVSGDDWTLMLPFYNILKDPLLAPAERLSRSASHSPLTQSFRHELSEEERRRAISCTSMTPTVANLRDMSESSPIYTVRTQTSMDGVTLRGSTMMTQLSPSTTDQFLKELADADRLSPPASSCSNLFVAYSGSGATYGSNGSEEPRTSMVSVVSLASGTSSSTATVVPGPWQRDQLQQQQHSSPSRDSQHLGDAENLSSEGPDRSRRHSGFSITTIPSIHQTTEFMIAETPGGGVRKTTVINRMPLPVGREAEIRARTVSVGGLQRSSPGTIGARVDAAPGWTLSSAVENGEKQGRQLEERGRARARKHTRNRESPLPMPGQWLTVAGRDGSITSLSSNESVDLNHGRLTSEKRGSMCSAMSGGEVKLFDDSASGHSGTYYSARSSFSMSANGLL